MKNFRSKSDVINRKNEKIDEFDRIIWSYDIMLEMRRKNQSYDKMFEKYGYKNIAIYGMGRLGKALVKELENTKVNIIYAIDRNSAVRCKDIEIKRPDDNLNKVDAIFVTIGMTKELETMLYKKVDCAIIEWMTFLMNENSVQDFQGD